MQVPNYKTTLCQPWSSTGQCSYESTCMYAHGRGQLRDVQLMDRNKDSNMANMAHSRQGLGMQPDSLIARGSGFKN